jgi:hypothetical protein
VNAALACAFHVKPAPLKRGAKRELYSLCVELASRRLNARQIALVLGANVGYVTGILRDLGLHRARTERGLEHIVSRLPTELQQRVCEFRTREDLREASAAGA